MIRTPYDLALKYLKVAEVPGLDSNPLVLAMLKLDHAWVENDDTPWCAAFINWIAWHCNLKGSGSLAARSFLEVGAPRRIDEAVRGFDIVILKATDGGPGPDVLMAPGHVGFFHAASGSKVTLLGGNQGNQVSIAAFPATRILGIRRLIDDETPVTALAAAEDAIVSPPTV